VTSGERGWLAERFEEHRPHLMAVAYRILGALPDADDAVQEAWLRLGRSDADSVENLRGWLTTVVARVCLNVLRARRARREEALGAGAADAIVDPDQRGDPEGEALAADAIALALLIVLESLRPAERVAFVLHDVFAVPFDEIAPIVGRSTVGARQLASRARRRIGRADADRASDPARQRELVDAFLAAARGGDLAALVALLAPDVTLRADAAAVAAGAAPETTGAPAVAGWLSGRARGAEPALVGGAAGLVWAPGGEVRVAFLFTFARGRVVAIDLVGDPARLRQLAPVVGRRGADQSAVGGPGPVREGERRGVVARDVGQVADG
jgi:RNA polymerase sigma-70 factor (ECF subfamily)